MNNPLIQGNGSSRVNAMKIDSIPDEFTKVGLQYTFEPGYRQDREETDEQLPAERSKRLKMQIKSYSLPGSLTTEAEGYDRDTSAASKCQDDLIGRLSKLGKEIIIILQTGSAVEMPWADAVDSILQMHLSGQAQGKRWRMCFPARSAHPAS